MSKTLTAIACETNQMRGLPQENVFLHNMFRLPADYGRAFVRTATANAPIQICAVASAQGDDTIAATALQSVMKSISSIVAQAQTRSVLDFDMFVDSMISNINSIVCNISIENKGTPIRISLTVLIIEGSVLRIVSVGNTRAVLVRQGKVIPLTEDQTVAHRYVQMGAIPAEAESSHPDRNVLTQYLGRFPQDGPVLPEKEIRMKLMDGDEICLLGVGVTQGLTDDLRNAILSKIAPPEMKSAELLSRCIQNNVKGGLTALVMRIEATLLLPGDPGFAPRNANGLSSTVAASATVASASLLPQQGMPLDAASSMPPSSPSKRRMSPRTKAIVTPIAVFLGCILVGYMGAYSLFNVGSLLKPKDIKPPITTIIPLSKVLYVKEDLVGLYPEESLTSTPISYLNRGEVVTLLEENATFSKITTTTGATGYVLASMLSETDPTIGESIPDMTADPTPIPSYDDNSQTPKPSSKETVSSEETTAPTDTPSVTPTDTPSVTPADPSVTPTITPIDSPPTVTPTPSPIPSPA